MKLYELKGMLKFYAEDIDDAFRRIGEYYLELSKEGTDVKILVEEGTNISLKEIKQ